jgi:peptide/nickel transport system permease protein
MAFDRPVTDLIPERAANTALLAATALSLATLVGVPLGVLSGTRRGGLLTGIVRTASLLLLSMPPLLTSLFLIFLAARTGWLPLGGMRSIETAEGSVIDLLRHMAIPVLALALPLAAMFERLQSGAVAETIGQPYILAAAARGVPRQRIVWQSALKPAIRPVLSVYGVVIGSLLSGSFVVEIITSWPGLGRLMLDALRSRDVFLVAGCAAAGSLFLALGTLISDAAIAAVDPRTAE